MNAQTETAMETIELATDVLVLGGGLTGLKAAVEIAAQGYHVMVAEETADMGLGREVRPLAGYSADEKAREFPGTGLGLNITKYLVEMQGGCIWFESEFRQGTTFHFTVPVAETG